MTVIGWIQILLFCAIIVAIVPPLGAYMTNVFNGERTFLSPILQPVETALYRMGGVNPKREQSWLTYTLAMLLFHVGGFLVLYVLLRVQGALPFNPAGQSAVADDSLFQYRRQFHHQYQLAKLRRRKHVVLSRPDARPDASELPVGGDRYRPCGCPYSRLCARIRQQRSEISGSISRAAPLYILLPICIVLTLLFLVWQGIPKRSVLCRRDHAGRRHANDCRRPGRFADCDQDARHQWRRIFQCQCGTSVRESDGAVEFRADDLDLRAWRGAH